MGSPSVADPPLPGWLLHVSHLSLLSQSSPDPFREAQLPVLGWAGWLTWPAFQCHGLFSSGDLFLGVRAGRAWGWGCSECILLPAGFLRIRLLLLHINHAVLIATPQGFACSTGFCFLCPCFSSAPKSLSVPTHLSPCQHLGSSRVQMAAGIFRRCWSRFGEHGDESTECYQCWAVCRGCRGHIWAPHGSRGRSCSPSAELWNCIFTFLGISYRGQSRGSSSHQAGLIPIKQVLANLIFLTVSKLQQVRKFKW